MKSDGKCVIDAIDIGEIEIDLFRSSPIINAKFAFTNKDAGTRFGSGYKNTGWSEATYAKLTELQASMEQDIVSELFSENAGETPVATQVAADTTDGVPGL